ncbi:MAG TPA: AI-2E family transporter YdiK [Rhizobacter sp.]|nr:AI-2E family transporter YdiK [Rhizobacter sp.]
MAVPEEVVVPVATDPPRPGVHTVVVRRDLTRNLLAILVIGVLIVGSFWVLRPFLLPGLWAMTIVVATWPVMLWLQAKLRRRALAVALMTLAILLVFVGPVVLAVETLVSHTDTITGWFQSLATAQIPPPPDWVRGLPLVGEKIAQLWVDIAAAGKGELAARVAPYASKVAQWAASLLGSVGLLVVQLLLTIVLSVVLYANGETARDALIRFGRRLAGESGGEVVVLAGRAIRAVALGVVVTALVQSLLAGLGLAVAGVPFASLLTAAILVLCIAQLGPVIVLLPAVGWLYWSGQPTWGTVLLVWTVIVGALDNVLRPLLIRLGGADLPLLLIFGGVIGGLFAFGIVGLFIGPVVLAVAYTLLQRWMDPSVAG